MALKAKITADDHAKLDSALQPFYVKASDGSFVLDAEGVEDVTGLKNAAEARKRERDEAEQRLKALQKQYEGVDPEKAREAIRRAEDLENKKLLDAGKVDELFAKKYEAAFKDWANKEASYKSQLAEQGQTLEKVTKALERVSIDSSLKDVAIKAGVRDTALPDLLNRARGIFKMKDDQVVPLNDDGTMRLGKKGEPLTFEDYVASLQTDAPHLFEPSRGTGSGSERDAAPVSRGGQVVFKAPAEGPIRLADFEAAQAVAAKNNSQLAIDRS